jgi:hypothetical protein
VSAFVVCTNQFLLSIGKNGALENSAAPYELYRKINGYFFIDIVKDFVYEIHAYSTAKNRTYKGAKLC